MQVRNSVEGWAAGGSIPGTLKNVERPFLQEYWRRFGGEPVGRQRAMPHHKSYTRHRSFSTPSAAQVSTSHFEIDGLPIPRQDEMLADGTSRDR